MFKGDINSDKICVDDEMDDNDDNDDEEDDQEEIALGVQLDFALGDFDDTPIAQIENEKECSDVIVQNETKPKVLDQKEILSVFKKLDNESDSDEA